ncbi:hypothetical protein L6Q96_17055 [Candidatus Binatia bacterium]|nr:hypothetical protein [Candidatus Binatia bacterium]
MTATPSRTVARAGALIVALTSLAFLWWVAEDRGGNLRTLAILVSVTYAAGWVVYFCLTGGALRTALLNCFISSGALALALGLLELPAWLGLIDYRLVLPPSRHLGFTRIKPWADPRNVPDAELIYRRPPGGRITGETIGDLVYWLGIKTDRRYTLDVRYDSRGFRNERDLDSAAVVLVGDSFLETGLVRDADSLSAQLRQRLGGVDVANLGLSGYGPQQALAVIRRYAVALGPRLVVWFFFEGNDLLDVPRYVELTRDWDRTLNVYHGFGERAFTTNVLRHLADRLTVAPVHDRPDARTRSCTLDSGRHGSPETIYFAYPGEPLTIDELGALGVTEALVESAQRLTSAHEITLLLAFVPTKFRVYYDYCSFPAGSMAGRWRPNDLPARMATWSAAAGVPFLDLTAPLRRAAERGDLVYFPDDGHWNPAGIVVAADALSAWICRSGVLPSDRSPCHP